MCLLFFLWLHLFTPGLATCVQTRGQIMRQYFIWMLFLIYTNIKSYSGRSHLIHYWNHELSCDWHNWPHIFRHNLLEICLNSFVKFLCLETFDLLAQKYVYTIVTAQLNKKRVVLATRLVNSEQKSLCVCDFWLTNYLNLQRLEVMISVKEFLFCKTGMIRTGLTYQSISCLSVSCLSGVCNFEQIYWPVIGRATWAPIAGWQMGGQHWNSVWTVV
jgi:hypothetical protein